MLCSCTLNLALGFLDLAFHLILVFPSLLKLLLLLLYLLFQCIKLSLKILDLLLSELLDSASLHSPRFGFTPA